MKKWHNNAGFWIRVLAMWIDLLVVYTALKVFFYLLLLLPFTVYFPFEATFLSVLFLYSTSMVYLWGRTLGKWALGLTVARVNNEKLSFVQVLLRETVLKLFSAIVLFLGILQIGFSKSKRGWHDLMSGSKVSKSENPMVASIYLKYSAITIFALLFGNYAVGLYNTYRKASEIKGDKHAVYPYMERDAGKTTEISQLATDSDSLYSGWLAQNSQTPEEYVVKIASEHQLTMIGEMHEVKNSLEFFNQIIPDLYHKAGVRCLGLEFLPGTMNRKIEKLVTNNTFDPRLALVISRSQPWKLWGYKEYWDVLETVWKLNKSLPDGAEKMRIVGIDEDWEGPFFAYFSNGADKIKGVSWLEKLKAPFVIDDFMKLVYREELMVYNIEHEIMQKGTKGVVWVGAEHTPVLFARPIIKKGKIESIKPRMGALVSTPA